MKDLLNLLCALEERNFAYRIEHNRDNAIMVLIAVPGERWEVEFLDDGGIEVEIFRGSDGVKSSTVAEILARLDGR